MDNSEILAAVQRAIDFLEFQAYNQSGDVQRDLQAAYNALEAKLKPAD